VGRHRLAGSVDADALTLISSRQARHKPIAAAIQTATLIQKSIVVSPGIAYRWTRERYQNTRNVLLRAGFVELVEPFRMTDNGPRPARYRLTFKGIEPVEERRARKKLTLIPSANALPI
jgi:hypothetical protein